MKRSVTPWREGEYFVSYHPALAKGDDRVEDLPNLILRGGFYSGATLGLMEGIDTRTLFSPFNHGDLDFGITEEAKEYPEYLSSKVILPFQALLIGNVKKDNKGGLIQLAKREDEWYPKLNFPTGNLSWRLTQIGEFSVRGFQEDREYDAQLVSDGRGISFGNLLLNPNSQKVIEYVNSIQEGLIIPNPLYRR